MIFILKLGMYQNVFNQQRDSLKNCIFQFKEHLRFSTILLKYFKNSAIGHFLNLPITHFKRAVLFTYCNHRNTLCILFYFSDF